MYVCLVDGDVTTNNQQVRVQIILPAGYGHAGSTK